MTIHEFVKRVVERGIAAALVDYKHPKDATKLEGAIEGFKSCLDKGAFSIAELLNEARRATMAAYQQGGGSPTDESLEGYWKLHCKELKIEWVANCLSAFLYNMPGFIPIVSVTERAVIITPPNSFRKNSFDRVGELGKP